MVYIVFFFFKQKTAYEMRISDWSSDVCSSDLDISIISVNGKTPRIDPSAFIAPGCRIIGDVVIGPDVSIWYNCVLRADVNQIRVGARSNIQDGSVVHCDGPMPHRPASYPPSTGGDVLNGPPGMVPGWPPPAPAL